MRKHSTCNFSFGQHFIKVGWTHFQEGSADKKKNSKIVLIDCRRRRAFRTRHGTLYTPHTHMQNSSINIILGNVCAGAAGRTNPFSSALAQTKTLTAKLITCESNPKRISFNCTQRAAKMTQRPNRVWVCVRNFPASQWMTVERRESERERDRGSGR